MTITIDLPPEIESALRSRAEASGQDPATIVRQFVIESLEDEVDRPIPQRSVEEFTKRLQAWIKLHPVLDHAVDDSRESIYAGRGE